MRLELPSEFTQLKGKNDFGQYQFQITVRETLGEQKVHANISAYRAFLTEAGKLVLMSNTGIAGGEQQSLYMEIVREHLKKQDHVILDYAELQQINQGESFSNKMNSLKEYLDEKLP